MCDFYKSFQEDKCIEKVKQVLYFIFERKSLDVLTLEGGRGLWWAGPDIRPSPPPNLPVSG